MSEPKSTARHTDLHDDFRRSDPERDAEVLLYNFVRYEADNLVFATIYAAFLVASLVLAGLCLALWTWLRLDGITFTYIAPGFRRGVNESAAIGNSGSAGLSQQHE